MNLTWQLIPFNKLTPLQLYCIMQIRNAVFVVEQNCAYQDADDKDQQSHHLCGWLNNELVAYCRLLPVQIAYENYPSIGRVVTSPKHRNLGLGKLLMTEALTNMQTLFPYQSIKIGAQLYLKTFYESFDFKQCGDEYLEDNIPHIPMQLKK